MTNQPHREWIYRQAYHMGRHVIGYEVQKVLAAVDWFKAHAGPGSKIGVAGYGEGRPDRLLCRGRGPADRRGPGQRLLRLAAARLGRAASTATSGACCSEFGDAEIATLDRPARAGGRAQRGAASGRPAAVPKGRRGGAAVGKLGTPALERRPRRSGSGSTPCCPPASRSAF